MPTIIRQNERSWAIEIISEINLLLKRRDLLIKRAGGESTLSSNEKSMFPDVLLYSDETRTSILQGWELKMPDVLITDRAFIEDAKRKANVLSINSFVIWNFSYGKLYIEDSNGDFKEARVWNLPKIKTRDDVGRYKADWTPIIEEIILEVNRFLVTGQISSSSVAAILSDNIMTAIIERNKNPLAQYYRNQASRNMRMEQRINVWWNDCKGEYLDDETDSYTAYAKNVLLNWTNRIIFANVVKKYHVSANQVCEIDSACSPVDASAIMKNIIAHGDYYNIFNGPAFDDLLPEDVWIDIVDLNQFLGENGINEIDQNTLQDVLENTVSVSKREMRGQYATPKWLADFLCQITVIDWAGNCADPCAGTGTIAKAIINNKNSRRYDINENLATTWVSDKYAYPIQIANIALTSMDTLNIPLNLFQEDVLNLSVGKTITIKSPSDGASTDIKYPPLNAVISNLPFVSSSNISEEDAASMTSVFSGVTDKTGLSLNTGRMDLYMAIPFKLHEIIYDTGRMGIIVSNAWLGTESGRNFYKALTHYFNIKSVILSGHGRWFKNADVITTIIILDKKSVEKPTGKERINFYLLNCEFENLNDSDKSKIISSIVLNEDNAENRLAVNDYTVADIHAIQNKGISMNALFHDAKWIDELSDVLIPIVDCFDVFRGERRGWDELFYPSEGHGIEDEYIKRVLKSSRNISGYESIADGDAFCCGRTLDDLHDLNHRGAIKWIEKFINLCNKTGRPLPDALRRANSQWYEMKDTSRADFVTSLNPDRRLFFAMFAEPSFINQRLIGLRLKRGNKDLIHALLNSVFEMFCIEGLGFGRGLGVLDMNKDNFERTYIFNPELINENNARQIIEMFRYMKNRNVLTVEEELKAADRENFDRLILRSLNIEDYYVRIRNSVLSMQKTRFAAR
jgi:hypothetical protein